MFSGESLIHSIINDPARLGVAMLLVMAVLKIALLALVLGLALREKRAETEVKISS